MGSEMKTRRATRGDPVQLAAEQATHTFLLLRSSLPLTSTTFATASRHRHKNSVASGITCSFVLLVLLAVCCFPTWAATANTTTTTTTFNLTDTTRTIIIQDRIFGPNATVVVNVNVSSLSSFLTNSNAVSFINVSFLAGTHIEFRAAVLSPPSSQSSVLHGGGSGECTASATISMSNVSFGDSCSVLVEGAYCKASFITMLDVIGSPFDLMLLNMTLLDNSRLLIDGGGVTTLGGLMIGGESFWITNDSSVTISRSSMKWIVSDSEYVTRVMGMMVPFVSSAASVVRSFRVENGSSFSLFACALYNPVMFSCLFNTGGGGSELVLSRGSSLFLGSLLVGSSPASASVFFDFSGTTGSIMNISEDSTLWVDSVTTLRVGGLAGIVLSFSECIRATLEIQQRSNVSITNCNISAINSAVGFLMERSVNSTISVSDRSGIHVINGSLTSQLSDCFALSMDSSSGVLFDIRNASVVGLSGRLYAVCKEGYVFDMLLINASSGQLRIADRSAVAIHAWYATNATTDIIARHFLMLFATQCRYCSVFVQDESMFIVTSASLDTLLHYSENSVHPPQLLSPAASSSSSPSPVGSPILSKSILFVSFVSSIGCSLKVLNGSTIAMFDVQLSVPALVNVMTVTAASSQRTALDVDGNSFVGLWGNTTTIVSGYVGVLTVEFSNSLECSITVSRSSLVGVVDGVQLLNATTVTPIALYLLADQSVKFVMAVLDDSFIGTDGITTITPPSTRMGSIVMIQFLRSNDTVMSVIRNSTVGIRRCNFRGISSVITFSALSSRNTTITICNDSTVGSVASRMFAVESRTTAFSAFFDQTTDFSMVLSSRGVLGIRGQSNFDAATYGLYVGFVDSSATRVIVESGGVIGIVENSTALNVRVQQGISFYLIALSAVNISLTVDGSGSLVGVSDGFEVSSTFVTFGSSVAATVNVSNGGYVGIRNTVRVINSPAASSSFMFNISESREFSLNVDGIGGGASPSGAAPSFVGILNTSIPSPSVAMGLCLQGESAVFSRIRLWNGGVLGIEDSAISCIQSTAMRINAPSSRNCSILVQNGSRLGLTRVSHPPTDQTWFGFTVYSDLSKSFLLSVEGGIRKEEENASSSFLGVQQIHGVTYAGLALLIQCGSCDSFRTAVLMSGSIGVQNCSINTTTYSVFLLTVDSSANASLVIGDGSRVGIWNWSVVRSFSAAAFSVSMLFCNVTSFEIRNHSRLGIMDRSSATGTNGFSVDLGGSQTVSLLIADDSIVGISNYSRVTATATATTTTGVGLSLGLDGTVNCSVLIDHRSSFAVSNFSSVTASTNGLAITVSRASALVFQIANESLVGVEQFSTISGSRYGVLMRIDTFASEIVMLVSHRSCYGVKGDVVSISTSYVGVGIEVDLSQMVFITFANESALGVMPPRLFSANLTQGTSTSILGYSYALLFHVHRVPTTVVVTFTSGSLIGVAGNGSTLIAKYAAICLFFDNVTLGTISVLSGSIIGVYDSGSLQAMGPIIITATGDSRRITISVADHSIIGIGAGGTIGQVYSVAEGLLPMIDVIVITLLNSTNVSLVVDDHSDVGMLFRNVITGEKGSPSIIQSLTATSVLTVRCAFSVNTSITLSNHSRVGFQASSEVTIATQNTVVIDMGGSIGGSVTVDTNSILGICADSGVGGFATVTEGSILLINASGSRGWSVHVLNDSVVGITGKMMVSQGAFSKKIDASIVSVDMTECVHCLVRVVGYYSVLGLYNRTSLFDVASAVLLALPRSIDTIIEVGGGGVVGLATRATATITRSLPGTSVDASASTNDTVSIWGIGSMIGCRDDSSLSTSSINGDLSQSLFLFNCTHSVGLVANVVEGGALLCLDHSYATSGIGVSLTWNSLEWTARGSVDLRILVASGGALMDVRNASVVSRSAIIDLGSRAVVTLDAYSVSSSTSPLPLPLPLLTRITSSSCLFRGTGHTAVPRSITVFGDGLSEVRFVIVDGGGGGDRGGVTTSSGRVVLLNDCHVSKDSLNTNQSIPSTVNLYLNTMSVVDKRTGATTLPIEVVVVDAYQTIFEGDTVASLFVVNSSSAVKASAMFNCSHWGVKLIDRNVAGIGVLGNVDVFTNISGCENTQSASVASLIRSVSETNQMTSTRSLSEPPLSRTISGTVVLHMEPRINNNDASLRAMQGTVSASSVVSSLVLPTAALAAQRLTLLANLGSCNDLPDVGEVLSAPVDFMNAPLQLRVGVEYGAWHRGAVIGDAAVWLVCVIIGFILTWITRYLHGSTESIVASAARLRLPGLYFIIVALLLQQVVVSSVLLLGYGGGSSSDGGSASNSAADRVIGAGGLLLSCAIVGAVIRVLDPRRRCFRALAEPAESGTQQRRWPNAVMRWLKAESVEWRPRDEAGDALFVERYGFLFESCSDGRHWWLLVDVLSTLVLGVVSGVVPATVTSCLAEVWFAVSLCAVQLVAVMALRPLNNRLEFGIVTVLYSLQVAIALCSALNAAPDVVYVLGIVFSAIAALLAVIDIIDVVRMHVGGLTSRIRRKHTLATRSVSVTQPGVEGFTLDARRDDGNDCPLLKEEDTVTASVLSSKATRCSVAAPFNGQGSAAELALLISLICHRRDRNRASAGGMEEPGGVDEEEEMMMMMMLLRRLPNRVMRARFPVKKHQVAW